MVAIVGPLLLSWLNNRHAIAFEERAIDRQEVVAARALEAATAVRVAAEGVADSLAATSKTTDAKLDVIHTLVNARLTEALARVAQLKQELKLPLDAQDRQALADLEGSGGAASG